MNAIVAVSKDWGIGKDNGLLFSIPEDMKFFRTMTSGKTIIMGRKTLESFPGGNPLKNRRNIVITTRKNISKEGVEFVSSTEQAAELVKDLPDEDVFVVGGAEIYREMLPYCKRVYVTKVNAKPYADKFFPDIDGLPDWNIKEKSDEHDYNGLTYKFYVYEKSDM